MSPSSVAENIYVLRRIEELFFKTSALDRLAFSPIRGHHIFSGESYAKAVKAPFDESMLSLKM
jgi:hypothetical protein